MKFSVAEAKQWLRKMRATLHVHTAIKGSNSMLVQLNIHIYGDILISIIVASSHTSTRGRISLLSFAIRTSF